MLCSYQISETHKVCLSHCWLHTPSSQSFFARHGEYPTLSTTEFHRINGHDLLDISAGHEKQIKIKYGDVFQARNAVGN